MEEWKTTHRLELILEFDTRVSEVCEKALSVVASPAWRKQLELFHDDHARHIDELKQLLKTTGRPGNTMRFSSPTALSHALSSLDQDISDQTRLHACLAWEEHGVEGYDEALSENHPPEIRSLLERHRAAEARHVATLRAALGNG